MLLIILFLVITTNYSFNIENKRKSFLGKKSHDDIELSIPIF